MSKKDFRSLAGMAWESQHFPSVQQDFRVYIDEVVFDSICSQGDNSQEVGGILVGDVFLDDGSPYIVVDSVIDALYSKQGETEVTFTHATWEHVLGKMDSEFKGKKIVGWYHTHPGFGIFLSEQDEFIHNNFFGEAYQVALVYDPVNRTHGVFAWKEDTLWRLREYWIGEHRHSWDGARDRNDTAVRKKGITDEAVASQAHGGTPVETARQDRAIYGGGSRWFTYTLVVLALLLGGIGGAYFGQSVSSLESRIRGAEDAVSSLNADLLQVFEDALSDEALGKNLAEWKNRLNVRLDNLSQMAESQPELRPAVNELAQTITVLDNAQRERRVANEMVQKLKAQSHNSQSAMQQLIIQLAAQQNTLRILLIENARLHAEMDNPKKARELINYAISIDPANKNEYLKILKQIEN